MMPSPVSKWGFERADEGCKGSNKKAYVCFGDDEMKHSFTAGLRARKSLLYDDNYL